MKLEMDLLVFSTERGIVGKVTNLKPPTILDQTGNSHEVDPEECRAATDQEIEDWNGGTGNNEEKETTNEVVEEKEVVNAHQED